MWPFSNSYPEVQLGSLEGEYDYIIVGEHFNPYHFFIIYLPQVDQHTCFQGEAQQDAF